MLFSTVVGLFLRNDEEREVLRAAALDCGLEPVDLHALELKDSIGDSTQLQSGIRASGFQLQLIITDDKSAGRERWSLATDQSFWGHSSPLMIFVQDEKQADASHPENSGITGQDMAYAWVLHRPLRIDTATVQLRQAAHASRVFAQRYHVMFEELHLARRIFDSLSNGITICDATMPDLPLVYVNPAFQRITGYPAHETCGQNCRFLHGSDTEQPGLTEIRKALREVRDARVLLRNYRKDGTMFWNEFYLSPILDLAGRLTHFVGIQNDVTDRVEARHELDHLAHYDALTGLVNRGLLMEQLKQALLRAERSGGRIAVLFFDLDNFKHVNDVFGHDAGDRLLKVVAERLKTCSRAGETVARLGGDEFIVVLEDLSDERQPTEVMQRIVSAVCEKMDLFDQPFSLTVSAGMALFPRDGDTPEVLLKAADFNMYVAKHQTRTSNQDKEEGEEGTVNGR